MQQVRVRPRGTAHAQERSFHKICSRAARGPPRRRWGPGRRHGFVTTMLPLVLLGLMALLAGAGAVPATPACTTVKGYSWPGSAPLPNAHRANVSSEAACCAACQPPCATWTVRAAARHRTRAPMAASRTQLPTSPRLSIV